MALFDTTFTPYVPFGSRILASGSGGTDVACLQTIYNMMLKTMNPPHGPLGSPIDITGHYGASTRAAVKNIQRYFNLVADGVVGASTYFVLGQGMKAFTTFGGPVYGSRTLQQGDSGGDVTIMQNRLNCFRYAHMLGQPATGSFDENTARAILAFKHDAESNGDTGFPQNVIAGFGFYDASWIYTAAGGRVLVRGRNGFDVVFIQRILSDLGYYKDRITGYYDAVTTAAVKAFQAAQKIVPDGVVGPVTYYHVGLNNNQSAPQPLSIAWPSPPIPKITVCSVGLTSQTPDLHPYGVASLVVNRLEGFESLDVVGNFLPAPSTYGAYNGYQFTLTKAESGKIIETQPMTAVGESHDIRDYAGTFSPGVKTIPAAIVTIYPVNTHFGHVGPAILSGSLSHCP